MSLIFLEGNSVTMQNKAGLFSELGAYTSTPTLHCNSYPTVISSIKWYLSLHKSIQWFEEITFLSKNFYITWKNGWFEILLLSVERKNLLRVSLDKRPHPKQRPKNCRKQRRRNNFPPNTL